jgi:hypothetical protein
MVLLPIQSLFCIGLRKSENPSGLVAQLVEQCPFNSKTPILAIFSSFLFPFAIVAEPLISLVIRDV